MTMERNGARTPRQDIPAHVTVDLDEVMSMVAQRRPSRSARHSSSRLRAVDVFDVDGCMKVGQALVDPY